MRQFWFKLPRHHFWQKRSLISKSGGDAVPPAVAVQGVHLRVVVTQKVSLSVKVVRRGGTVGLGRAGRWPHRPRRHGKYPRARWTRRRCSFWSRSCAEVVTPVVAVWEVVLPVIIVQQVLPRVLVAREVVLSVQVARGGGPAGHGHARRRSRRPRRHGNYCSCESRSFVDLVTPALSGVFVRARKMAEARYLLPFL